MPDAALLGTLGTDLLTMLHKFKVALSSSTTDEKTLLKADQRLANIDTQLSSLMQLCSLQKHVEENERAWSVLSYSIRTVGHAFRHAATLDDDGTIASQELYNSSNALIIAGEKLPSPRLSDANREIRSFCEIFHLLRLEHTKAVNALRKKCYYAKKVCSLQQVMPGQSSDGNGRETLAQRLNRNEKKYEEASVEVESKTAELERKLVQVKMREEKVLATAMRAFLELQLKSFRNASLESVIDFLPEVGSCNNETSDSSIRTTTESDSRFDSAFSGELEAVVSTGVESEIDTFVPHPSMIDRGDDEGFDTAEDDVDSTAQLRINPI